MPAAPRAWTTPADVLQFANTITDEELPLAIGWAATRTGRDLTPLVKRMRAEFRGAAMVARSPRGSLPGDLKPELERLHVLDRAAVLEKTYQTGEYVPLPPLHTALTAALLAVLPDAPPSVAAERTRLLDVVAGIAVLLAAVREAPDRRRTVAALIPGWAGSPEQLITACDAVQAA